MSPRRRCPRSNARLGARPALRRFPQQTVNRNQVLVRLEHFSSSSCFSLPLPRVSNAQQQPHPLDPARPVSNPSNTLRRRRQRNALGRRSFFHQFPNETPTTSPRGFSSPPDHSATNRASRPPRRPRRPQQLLISRRYDDHKEQPACPGDCPSWLRNVNSAGPTWPARNPSRALTE